VERTSKGTIETALLRESVAEYSLAVNRLGRPDTRRRQMLLFAAQRRREACAPLARVA
jgi:hypothetical protein